MKLWSSAVEQIRTGNFATAVPSTLTPDTNRSEDTFPESLFAAEYLLLRANFLSNGTLTGLSLSLSPLKSVYSVPKATVARLSPVSPFPKVEDIPHVVQEETAGLEELQVRFGVGGAVNEAVVVGAGTQRRGHRSEGRETLHRMGHPC